MNKLLVLILPALMLSGCATTNQQNLASFIKGLPSADVADISQNTRTPVYMHSESASGITYDASAHQLVITNAKASLGIPEFGISWDMSVTMLRLAAPAPTVVAQPALTVPMSSQVTAAASK